MEIAGWERRYRETGAGGGIGEATPLLVETAGILPSGRALDLACGTGRNALWLAGQGWDVTAVDGAEAAIATLRARAAEGQFAIDARVADLGRHEFAIGENAWDLVAMCYYLQRDLFEPAKRGVAPGGLLLAIVHTTEDGEEPTAHRLRPGELAGYFRGWDVVHSYEGKPRDTEHRRAVSEIVVRKPVVHPPG